MSHLVRVHAGASSTVFIEHADLAEEVTCIQVRQNDFMTIIVLNDHRDRPALEVVKFLREIARIDDRLLRGIGPPVTVLEEAIQPGCAPSLSHKRHYISSSPLTP